jgi:hypothetical protein
MLKNTSDLYGYALKSLDGEIGKIRDFYFDDTTWAIRYLIADTGAWLNGRMVLLSPHSFGRLDQAGRRLEINLTRAQIESSPPIDAHAPVSRQYEIDYFRHYSWPPYWEGGALWGFGGFPVTGPGSGPPMDLQRQLQRPPDKHLRSSIAVHGYDIQATDGGFSHVAGFLVDDRSWEIRSLTVAARHWFSGAETLIAAAKVLRISYEDSKVFVGLTKAEIEQSTTMVAEESTARGHIS